MSNRDKTTVLHILCWLIAFGLTLLALAVYQVANAQEPIICPQVCPPCNVKAEWTDEGYQYEYTDNTAVITGTTPISVCWQASATYNITSVCIKAGQMLFHPEPGLGCWTTPWQNISHVVVCTEKTTAIGLVGFKATTVSMPDIMLFLIGCIGMLSGLCIIAWAERNRR